MTNGFEVSTDRLVSSADRLKQVADEFEQQVAQFKAEVTGYGEPWGGDDMGMLIGMAHSACFEAALRCFEENAAEIGEGAEALKAVAENYVRTEESNVQAVNSIGKALG